MKKILVIILLQMAITFNVFAQGEGDRIVNPTWKLSSGALSPTVNTWKLSLGSSTTASGSNSVAMGYSTTASGSYSTAMGLWTTASGNNSNAMGYTTTANSYASFAIGRYNVGGGTADSWVATDPLFEIGIGADVNNKANAFTVLKNGNVITPLIIGGTGTTSTLTYKTTSGVGATGARHIFQVGNNGATEAMTILNSGFMGIGTTAPGAKLEVANGDLWINNVSTALLDIRSDSGNSLIRDSYIRLVEGGSAKYSFGYDGSLNAFTIDEGATTLTDTPEFVLKAGNVGIGVTTFPTTLAKGLTIANGTAPTVKANSASLYVVLGEMWVYDSTGTATKISPHNDAGDWVFDSYNAETGERTYINMITLAETLEVLSGKTLIVRDNVLQEVQKKDAYEEYDSTITISKKVTEDEATSLVIDTVYTEIADTTQLVEYYTYDDKTKKVEKKTRYKIDKAPNYISEWKIKDGYKLNETNGDFEKTTSTKKANKLKSNVKVKNGKYYIINLARQ